MRDRWLWTAIAIGGAILLYLGLRKEARAERLESVERYWDIYEMVGTIWNVPPSLIAAVVHVESRGNPTARGAHGEWGLMQIKCETARDMGFTGRCEDLLNEYVNVYYGTKYLRWQYDRYGDWRMAISAYNAGSYTERNREYVEKVISAWRAYEGV